MNKMGESKIMKKYKGVVFFDYDGTTVDESGENVEDKRKREKEEAARIAAAAKKAEGLV